MTMKPLKAICSIVLAVTALSGAAADMKFFKKAAKLVWDTHPEYFDARREIPDSVAEGHSAVVLMKYEQVNADFDKTSYYNGDKTFTRRKSFKRIMVKLLD